MDNLNQPFKLSALCLAVACLSSTAFALEDLEKLDDYALAESTGEGIALLPENAYMVFRGAGASEASTAVIGDRTKDTGYINFIPIGPLTTEAQNSGAGKADIYMYGLALSKADGNLNSRLSATSPHITSWGTSDNPWILKVNSLTNVPNFSPTNCTGATDASCFVTALRLEAPLHHLYALDYSDNTKDVSNNMPTTGATGQDAYKLKFALWADAFVLDPTKGGLNNPNDPTRFDLGGAGRANRLRLQAVWDGLSLNGSNINIFQTLAGAKTTNTNGHATNTAYNNTLGIAGLIRLNSGDTRNLKLTYNDATSDSTGTMSGWNTIHAGTDPTLGSTGTGCNNGGTGAFNTSIGCQVRVQQRTRTDSKTTTRTITAPTTGVLRLSTRETGTTQGLLDSPAFSASGIAPTFDATEGVYLYGANINLVLGNVYQPLMFNKDQNSNNFSMEVARIPNKQEIYSKIYTRYAGDTGDAGVTYAGSTCSVYYCGSPIKIGNATNPTYQGNTATHSSISIGTTLYDPNTGLMTAYTGADAMGVSFGKIGGAATSVTTTATSKEVQYQQRDADDQNWVQQYSCSTFGGCSAKATGHLYQWKYYTNPTTATTVILNPTTKPADATCSANWVGNCGPIYSPNQNTTVLYGTTANRNWDNSGAAWRNVANTNIDNFIGLNNAKTGVAIPAANQAPAPVLPTNVGNNFGSAVIDGLLIQHMKITTKGL